jgi:hypothetical protein
MQGCLDVSNAGLGYLEGAAAGGIASGYIMAKALLLSGPTFLAPTQRE